MNKILILLSLCLPLVTGTAISQTNISAPISFSSHSSTSGTAILQTDRSASVPKPYNENFNPRQKEYPNHLGFNDLHIQAIRHLVPDSHDVDDPKLQTVVHHHCKAYDDGTLICLMFHSGMKDQDKPIGFEYIITSAQYKSLPNKEKKYWHYHRDEIPRAHASLPDMTADEVAKVIPAINETYGKVVYFQQPQDKLPLGEPYIVIVQDMPEQD